MLSNINDNRDLIADHTGLTEESFTRLLRFVVDNTYFSFEGSFYLQTFGTPMGLPISPILAQIVMDDLLDIVLSRLDVGFALHL